MALSEVGRQRWVGTGKVRKGGKRERGARGDVPHDPLRGGGTEGKVNCDKGRENGTGRTWRSPSWPAGVGRFDGRRGGRGRME